MSPRPLSVASSPWDADLQRARSARSRGERSGPGLTLGWVNHGKCTRRHVWARILANIRAHARCRVY